MGFIVNEPVQTKWGFNITGVYVTFHANYSVNKQPRRMEYNPVSGEFTQSEEKFSLGAMARIYVSKQDAIDNKMPLLEGINVNIDNLTFQQTQSSPLSTLLYPALKQQLGYSHYVDDV
jgi:hypothetical protein